MSLGQIIRENRDKKKLTLDDISRRTGYSKPYLSTIETGRVKNPPADELLVKLEKILGFTPGALTHIAHLEKLPADVREAYEQSQAEISEWRTLVNQILNEGQSPDALAAKYRELVGDTQPNAESVQIAGKLVPVINAVMAGYPVDFDDKGYPPGGADDYVRCPDLHDPSSFAVRVVGDSMEPKYYEGDIIIFSPAADVNNGDDCFVRMADPHETTFKQVFFEEEGRIRLQPRNNNYAPLTLPREKINGLWRAVIRYERLNA